MAEAEHAVPSIRIHVDQQVTIESVRGQEDLEDATVATEITGFDVEDDAYVLKGALTFSGFLRQGEEGGEELPDALDDRDVFAAEDLPEDAPILPLHHRLPFVLQVPVAAQLEHQRRDGILDVNPKVGQWNVHVLGDQTVHLRAELVVQGLSASEGYVFRCGTQEEGVAAQQLDALLDQEEERAELPPQELPGVEFEPPFDQVAETSAWTIEEARHEEAEDAAESEDDWIIESAPDDAQAAEARESAAFAEEAEADEASYEAEADSEEDEIIFTPDPNLAFPMPEPGSLWAQQLKETEAEARKAYDFDAPLAGQPEFVIPQFQPTTYQAPRFDLPNFETPNYELPELNVPQPQSFEAAEPPLTYGRPFAAQEDATARPDEAQAQEQQQQADDEDAFVLEAPEWQETRHDDVDDDVDESLIGRTEAYDPNEIEHGDEVVEASLTPEAEAHDEERPAVAEYEFEDEVAVEATSDLDVQVIESPAAAKPSGPKLSVGGKSAVVEDAPIKLSALLGDSRSRAEVQPAAEAPVMEQAPPAPPAPQAAPQAEVQVQEQVTVVEEQVQIEVTEVKLSDLAHPHKESSSHQHHHHHGHDHDHDHDHHGESASVHTGQKGNVKQNDSIWSDMLLSESGEKATMKFKIVHPEDNIHDLAERYRTSVHDLLRANGLQDQSLAEGQVLYIPELKR